MTAMKNDLKLVNIDGGAFIKLVDVTRTTVVSYYQPTADAS